MYQFGQTVVKSKIDHDLYAAHNEPLEAAGFVKSIRRSVTVCPPQTAGAQLCAAVVARHHKQQVGQLATTEDVVDGTPGAAVRFAVIGILEPDTCVQPDSPGEAVVGGGMFTFANGLEFIRGLIDGND